jgi:hypothetical protein
MSKTLARNLILTIVLGTLPGVAVHADTTTLTSTVSADSVTGAEPVPTSPTQKPSSVITIVLTVLGVVL